ncbi:MAG TPA: carboxylesterase family protein [Puia sp.]|nr:carboxylesterase family protein [Puia sp.]
MQGRWLKIFPLVSLLLITSVAFYPRENDFDISQFVKISSGNISGVKNEKNGVVAFKGIPYAAPPVGDMRWQAPAPPAKWDGTKKCDHFGPSPIQAKPVPFLMLSTEFMVPESPMSEDCLYLNVWTAARSSQEKRPVFVWIYGGGFATGGASAPAYDGEAMAAKGVVFVSFNYRLGIFGFFSHPELSAESHQHASGNYGLLDQIAVLKWIKENIASFGGDPKNVTIAGQSAGAMSVNCLLSSPLAKGLFHRAIAESGNLVLANPFIKTPNLKKAEQQGIQWASKLNKPSISDLRNIPAEELLHEGMGLYGPIVDGYVLKEAVPEIYGESKQDHVPLLIGWNGGEGIVFVFKKKDDYISDIRKQFGAEADKILQYYPASTDEEAAASQIAISRDKLIGISTYNWALMESNAGNHAVYVYNFNKKPSENDKFSKYGAFHTAEIPYALSNLQKVNRPWEAVDDSLSQLMSSYWINFARTGNPNGTGLASWGAFDSTHTMVMVLDKSANSEKLPGKDGLDLLYELYIKSGLGK